MTVAVYHWLQTSRPTAIIATADILLVHDSAHAAELTEHVFRSACPRATIASVTSSEQALYYVFRAGHYSQRDRGSPRLILLDLEVPGIGGLQVLERLKQDSSSRLIPIVAMADRDDATVAARCYTLGANSLLHKSSDMDRYKLQLRHVAQYWLELNVVEAMRSAAKDRRPLHATTIVSNDVSWPRHRRTASESR